MAYQDSYSPDGQNSSSDPWTWSPDITFMLDYAYESQLASEIGQRQSINDGNTPHPNTNLSPYVLSQQPSHQQLSLFPQEFIPEPDLETSAIGPSTIESSSFFPDIDTMGTSPYVMSPENTRGPWLQSTGTQGGTTADTVSFVGGGWPPISSNESIFPTEAGDVTDDEFVNGAFPPLERYAAPVAAPLPPAADCSDSMLWAQPVGHDDSAAATAGGLMTEPSRHNEIAEVAAVSLVTTHICCACSHEFFSKGALGKHEKTHTRPHVCDECGLGHGAERDKNRHMWAKHPREAAQRNIPAQLKQCPHCSMRARHDNLKRHIRTQHGGVRP